MEFSQLKENYPFLEKLLNFYDKLEKPLAKEEDKYQDILELCNKHYLLKDYNTGEYNKFCLKLLKNLLLLKGSYNDDFQKRCSNLYVWLYFEMKKFMIPDAIIKNIFLLPNSIVHKGHKYHYCPYFSFNDKIRNPENLMKLRIFNDNAYTFQSMLMGLSDSNDCSLISYINKCIEVYRDMNSKYCSGSDGATEENQNSCDIIRKFDNLYSSYIYNKGGIFQNFPSLSSNTPTKAIYGCSLKEIESYRASAVQSNQSDRYIIPGVSRALGVMAGIPPFLALIYKYAPFGNMFRSQFEKRIPNNIGENELFDPTTEYMNDRFDHTRHNVLYGSVGN